MGIWFRCQLFAWRRLISKRERTPINLYRRVLPKAERRFLDFIKENSEIKSHSQLYQDFLPLFCLGKIEKGFFVEVGVGDGISNSNSFILENFFC